MVKRLSLVVFLAIFSMWVSSVSANLTQLELTPTSLTCNATGTIYYSSASNQLMLCTSGTGSSPIVTGASNVWTLSGSNLYPNSTSYNVGIGTTGPLSALHVADPFVASSTPNVNSGTGQVTIQGTGTSRTPGSGAALSFLIPAGATGGNAWDQGRILVTPDNSTDSNASGRMYLQTRYYNGTWDWNNNLILTSNGNTSAENHNIVNVAAPINANDAATKSYVDSSVTGGGASGNLSTLTVSGTTTLATAGGNVGIGTTNPTQGKFVVNFSNDSRIVANQTSANNYGYQWATNGTRDWDAYVDATNKDLHFYSQTKGEVMVLQKSTGNVGIGTTNPTYLLTVAGGSAGGNAFYVEANNQSNSTGAILQFNGGSYNGILNVRAATVSSGGSAGINLVPYTQNNNQVSLFVDQSDSQKFKINVNQGANLGTFGGTTAFTIQQNGYVGINTTNPGTNLDVNGNAESSIYYDRDNTNYYIDAAQNVMPYSALFAGNVGIGTTAPQLALHVKSHGTSLSGLGYPQAVFEDSSADYPGIVFAGSSGIHGVIRVENGNGFTFYTTANGTWAGPNIWTNALRIQENGNIGIGGVSNPLFSVQVLSLTPGAVTGEFDGALNSAFGGFGNYQNYITSSEDFSMWPTSGTISVTKNTYAAPNGATTADTIAGSSNGAYVYYGNNQGQTGAATYVFSLWLRTTSGTNSNVDLSIADCGYDGGANNSIYTVTTSWQRFTATRTFTPSGYACPVIRPGGGGGTGTVVAWGAQLEKSTTGAGVYAKTSGTAITTASNGLVIDAAGSSLFSGNVGIGTVTPGYKLDVNGFGNFAGGMRIGSQAGGWYYYPNVISSQFNSSYTGAFIIHTNIARTSNEMFKIRVNGYGYGNSYDIDFTVVGYSYSGTNGSVDGASGAVVSYSIVDNGNDGLPKWVGIDANGKVAIAIGSISSSYYFYRLSADYWSTRVDPNASSGWSIDQSTTSGFGWKDIKSLSPDITQLTNGNVGIGTASPTTAGLVVATNVSSVGIDVSNNRIQNVGTPVNAADAATKNYVDSAITGGSGSSVGYWTLSSSDLYANSTGYNVAIGATTASGYKLYVNGGEGLNGTLSLFGGGKTASIWNDGNLHIKASAGGDYLWLNADIVAFYNYAQTAALGSLSSGGLSVVGNSFNLGSGSGMPVWTQYWDQPNGRLYMGFSGSSGGDIQFYANGTNNGATQWFHTNGSANFAGSVGINMGVSTPGTTLDVAGNAQASIFYDRDNTNYYLDPAGNTMPFSLATGAGVNIGGTVTLQQGIQVNNSSNYLTVCGPNGGCSTASNIVAGRIQLSADGSFANAESIDPGMGGIRAPGNAYFATNSGTNVGIGTTGPAYKLTVVGSMYSVEVDNATSTGATTIDWSRSNTQTVILGASIALTFTNGQPGGHYTLALKQDATGSRTITSWGSNVRWSSGVAPTLTTTANKTDYIEFVYDGLSSTFDGVGFNANF